MFMHMKDSFSRLSLRTKFNISLFAFIIFPLILLTVFVNMIFKNSILSHSRETILQSLLQTQSTIESTLNSVEAASLDLIANDNLQQAGKLFQANKVSESDIYSSTIAMNLYSLTMELSKNLMKASSFYSVSFSNSKTMIFQFDKNSRVIDVADDRYDAQAFALKGRGFWTSVYTQSTYGINTLSYVRAIQDVLNYKSAPLGILKMNIYEDLLLDLYKNINRWEGSDIFIMDTEGNVISAKNKNRLGKPYGDIMVSDKNFHGSNGYFEKKINSTANSVFYYKIKNTGWFMLLTVPEKVLNKELEIYNLILLLTLFACIAFGVIFTIIQSTSIITPLSRIVRATEKIQNQGKKSNTYYIKEI